VDCSKAEQFFDLNLDLYVPHVATPKPPAEQDLEEEDDIIRPVSTPKPTEPPPSTTVRTTTTTTARATSPATPKSMPSTTPRSRPTTTQSPEATTKGYSSFNYYLKTPHSHVSSGYNSQSRQSYIYNHNPSGDESDESYTVNENTGRKIPTGPKTIVYNTPSSTSSTARPSNGNNRTPSRNSIQPPSTAPTSPSKQEDILDEQYADEYYDEDLSLDYDVSSSTAGSQQLNSKQANSYELGQQSKNNQNSYQAQPQTQYRGKTSYTMNENRDGRSTGLSKSTSGSGSSDSNSRNYKGGSESVSVAVSSSKSTSSPPVITRPPTKRNATTTTTEEPYYYDDDYPEDEVVAQQPAIIVRGTSSSTSRSAGTATAPSSSSSSKTNNNAKSSNTATSSKSNNMRDPEPTGPSGPSGPEADNEYYDDGGDGPSLNVNDHHFTHRDVPRIPFAKPNVPRVLVTNGKPFLPRLRRQSVHHRQDENFDKQSHHPSEVDSKKSVPMVDISSLWDSLAYPQQNYQRAHLDSYSHGRKRKRRNAFGSKSNLSLSHADDSVINSKRIQNSEGTKR
jgi:hypothetical protein